MVSHLAHNKIYDLKVETILIKNCVKLRYRNTLKTSKKFMLEMNDDDSLLVIIGSTSLKSGTRRARSAKKKRFTSTGVPRQLSGKPN